MQRDKGRKAEAEVARLYGEHGFQVRGLEGAGDHLAVGHGYVIHSEVKRQEVLRLPLWARQAWAEAPAGTVPVVAFRKSREPWHAITPEQYIAAAAKAAGLTSGIHYSLLGAAETWWARFLLVDLLSLLTQATRAASAQEAL